MSAMGRSDVSIETLFKIAAMAALAIVVAQFVLDIVIDLVDHGEIRFDEGDRILNLLIGVLTTATIVAGAYWIVAEGTTEWVVARAVGAVYAATIVEDVLRSFVFDWADLEAILLLTNLSTVLYFLTFVIAYRMAFEDRGVTDWDPGAITSKL